VPSSQKPPKRSYSAKYERFVPLAIGLLVTLIIVLLVIIFSVALGWTPG